MPELDIWPLYTNNMAMQDGAESGSTISSSGSHASEALSAAAASAFITRVRATRPSSFAPLAYPASCSFLLLLASSAFADTHPSGLSESKRGTSLRWEGVRCARCRRERTLLVETTSTSAYSTASCCEDDVGGKRYLLNTCSTGRDMP